MRTSIFATAILTLAIAAQSFAQLPEDALRFATPGIGVGARAVGMGGAYTGVASDYSAIYWNPAGLSQSAYGEFSIGLNYNSLATTGTLFGNDKSTTINSTNLNSLGLVYPLPVRRGSAAIAFGFHRQSSFADGFSFEGFNPNGSIIQTYAPNGTAAPSDLSNNIAYQLFLANVDTLTGQFDSPIVNRLTQLGRVVEGRGLNNWSVGGSFEIAKNFSVGATLNYVAGSYRYDRTYTEEDRQRLYESFPFDFNSLAITDYIESDISGLNAKFGVLYRNPDRFRFGITIQTPTSFNIRETYGTTAEAHFDNGDVEPSGGPYTYDASTEYNVVTPWVFGAGASLMLQDLVLAADVQLTDWTQVEFADADPSVMQQNNDIKTLFRTTFDYRFGAEYEFKDIGLRLRGGYMFNRSPFEGDPSKFDRKAVTGGIGILLGESTMIDLAVVHGWWETFVYNYSATSRVDQKTTANTAMLTLTHRF